MKKLMIALCAFALVGTASAQTTEAQPVKTELSKEEKAKAKAAKEQLEEQAFAQAGLTAEEIAKVKEINAESQQKGKELAKATLTDEEKATKKKELNAERKQKLIAVIGEAKYKNWQDARKKLTQAKPEGGGQ